MLGMTIAIIILLSIAFYWAFAMQPLSPEDRP